jgi:hypothetical protein
MRKTIAYFLSLIMLFTLGLLILHPSYRALSDWLGSLVGSHIYTMFTLIYLLLANPLRYVTVALVWVIVGLLIGVISGKRLGASITAFLVWFTMIPLLAASLAGMYFNLEARGMFSQESLQALSLIPVIPEQLTFNSLFQIPIFSDLVFQLIEIFPTMGEGSNPQAILIELATPHLVAIASKPVLIIVSAIIGAVFSSVVFESVGKILPSRKTAMGLLIIGIISLQTVPTSTAINVDDGIYTEILGGYVEEQGRVVIGELILGNQIEYIPLDTPEAEGLVASIVFTQKIYDPSILYTLPSEEITDYLHFRNLLPSTFAVNVYLGDDVESIKNKSNQVIATVEQNLGIQFQEIATMPLPNEGGPEASFPMMTAALYYSQNTLEETTANIIQGFEDTGGFADIIGEKIETGKTLDIELYATGFVYIEPFKSLLPIPEVPQAFIEPYNALVESRFSFIAGVQLVKDAVKPQGSGYLLDLKETLGVQSTPSYVVNSDGSFIIMARSNMTGVTDPLDPTVHIKTSIPENSMDLMFLTFFLQGMGAIELEGGSPSTLDTQIFIPEITLPEVQVTKTSQTESNGGLEITVTVKNNGDQTIRNLELVDAFPEKYDILVSGANTASWMSLSPGGTVSLSYTVNTQKPGSYSDIPALLSYEIGEIQASTTSNILQSVDKSPNPASMLTDDYQAITTLLDTASEGTGRMLTMAIAGFVLLIATIDVFRLVRKPKTGDSREPEPVPSPPEEPGDSAEYPL